jgi:hypothetical protein
MDKKLVAQNMRHQAKILNNSIDRFPVKPLSSQGTVNAMNLSIEMLSNRRQQSLELQRGEDHTEPRSNLVIKHKLT